MGTVLTVTVVASGQREARALAGQAVHEVRLWEDALTIWRSNGELARLNAKAGQGPVKVSSRLARGLREMLRLSAATGGAFHPAVRGPDASRKLPSPPLPTLLRMHGDSAELARGASLDPGGIGKGLALEAAEALLRAGGAKAAFLDFGGSSQTAIGVPPGNARGWPVQLSSVGRQEALGCLLLRDASLSTSEAGATDTRPIVDPRTGSAVPAPRLATVRARSATDADAWSTALVVRGGEGLEAAAQAGIDAVVDDGRARGATPGFAWQGTELAGCSAPADGTKH